MGFPNGFIIFDIENVFTILDTVCYSYRNLYKYIRKSSVDVTLKNVKMPVTFFAPSHMAFEIMQGTRIGRELLGEGGENENKLQQVGHGYSSIHYLSKLLILS